MEKYVMRKKVLLSTQRRELLDFYSSNIRSFFGQDRKKLVWEPLYYMYIVNSSPQVVWSIYPGLYNGVFYGYFWFFEIPVKNYNPNYEVISG